MSIPLIINTQVFNYPSPGDAPGWGEDATDAFAALVAYVNGISPPTDIVLASANLVDNVSVPTTIANLVFNSSLIYGAIVEMTIQRSNNSTTATEIDTLDLVYSNGQWYMDRQQTGTDTGVVFSITNSGQLQYTTTALGGSNYSGIMVVRARTFPIVV